MIFAVLLGSLVTSSELEKAFRLAPKKQLPGEHLLRIIADGSVEETLSYLIFANGINLLHPVGFAILLQHNFDRKTARWLKNSRQMTYLRPPK
jgi:hypothetical protein